jgi:hypothetical protein
MDMDKIALIGTDLLLVKDKPVDDKMAVLKSMQFRLKYMLKELEELVNG